MDLEIGDRVWSLIKDRVGKPVWVWVFKGGNCIVNGS